MFSRESAVSSRLIYSTNVSDVCPPRGSVFFSIIFHVTDLERARFIVCATAAAAATAAASVPFW